MLLLTIGSLWVYSSYENHIGSIGPVFLQPVEHQGNVTDITSITAHTPTSSLVEASCNGNGIVEVYDIITGEQIDRHTVYGHAKYQFILPREGDYLIINNGTEQLTCSFRFIKKLSDGEGSERPLHQRLDFRGTSCVYCLEVEGMNVIEAENLKKIFGSIHALDGVTVEIPEGITLILGPNGGGKSTFLKLATGVYRPTSGEIKVFGERPWNNWKVKARFGVAYDPPAFPQFVTGREWLKLFAESKGYSGEEVERIAELFDAKSFLDKRISGYSSGMLKRLSLAQAFIGKPEIIFLDEPLANIDFDSMERVIDIVGDMSGKMNFVIISHIWEPLMPVVDWVVVIGNGKLVLSGKADEVQDEVEKLFKPRVKRRLREESQRGPLHGQEGRQTPAGT